MGAAKCKRCGRCCEIIGIPAANSEWDMKWMEGRGGTLIGQAMFFPLRCKWLSADKKCEIHGDKPEWCKKFPLNFGPVPWLLNIGCKFFVE